MAVADTREGRAVKAVLQRAARARACPAEFFDFAAREDGGTRARIKASSSQRAALVFANAHVHACVRMPTGTGRTTLLAWLALWCAGTDPERSVALVGPSREAAEQASRQGWEALGGDGGRPTPEVRVVFPDLRRGGEDDAWTAGAWTVERERGPSTREPTCRAVDGTRADLVRARPLGRVLVDDYGERERAGMLDSRRWFANHVVARADVSTRRAAVLVLGGDAHPDDLVSALERAGWPTLSMRADGVVHVSNAPGWEAPGLLPSGDGFVLRSEPGAWRGRTSAPDGLVEEQRTEAEERKGPTLADFTERYRDDFLGFVRLLEVRPREAVGSGRVPFEPTAIQLAYCRARTPRDVVLKPRQVKITTIELARDLWFFLMKPGVAVRVLVQSSEENEMLTEVSERISIFLDALRTNAGLDLEAVWTRSTRTEYALPNGSTFRMSVAGASEAAAQKKGRGGTIHRLHCTEVASWEWAGQTLNAVMESIAGPEKGTEVVFESTANGAGGDDIGSMLEASGAEYFYAACQGARAGTNGLTFHFFPWTMESEYSLPLAPGEVMDPEDQPDTEKRERERQLIDAGSTQEQLKWWRRKAQGKGLEEMDQEFPHDPDLCFIVSGRQYFDKQKVEGFVVNAEEPIVRLEVRRPGAFGELRVWRRFDPRRRYCVVADPSQGVGRDRGAIQVWERGTGRHCATLVGQLKPSELAREAARLGYEYGQAPVVVERNNHGHAVLQELEREDPVSFGPGRKTRYPRVWRDHDGRVGWNSTETSRVEALSDLDRAIRDGAWTTPDVELARELRTFVVNRKGKAEAKRKKRDDLVLTAAIAGDILRRRFDDDVRPRTPKPVTRTIDETGIG